MTGLTHRDIIVLSGVWGFAAALYVIALLRGVVGGMMLIVVGAVVFAAIMSAAIRSGRAKAASDGEPHASALDHSTSRATTMASDAATSGAAQSRKADRSPSSAGDAAAAIATASFEKAEGEATKPALRDKPREGGADDLKRIKGVGPKLEAALHSMGVHHFDQIASWTPEEVAWMDANLEGFKGRVSRDGWVSQARILAGGGDSVASAPSEADDAAESRA